MIKFIAVFILTACSVKIDNLNKHERVPLLHVMEMPSKEDVNQGLPSVVVIANVPENDEAKTVNAHEMIKNSLVNVLQNEKFATIFERKKSKAIEDEITLASFEGKQGEDLKSADYIIEIDVNSLSFSRKTKKGIDPLAIALVGATALLESKADNGYSTTTQMLPNIQNTQYEYTAKIAGLIKVYQLPKISLVKSIPIEAMEKSTELASVDSNVAGNSISAKIAEKIASKKSDTTLFQDVTKKSVKNVLPAIKKFLQKKAYIMEKREWKKSIIFKINRGSNDGIKPLDKLTIRESVEELNPLTQEDDISVKVICRGVIAKNGVEESASWVVFTPECQENVRLGHEAFVEY